jgi:hypothetical protein
MKKWIVKMEVTEDITVTAETEDEAREKAYDRFDPYALDFMVVEVCEVTGE